MPSAAPPSAPTDAGKVFLVPRAKRHKSHKKLHECKNLPRKKMSQKSSASSKRVFSYAFPPFRNFLFSYVAVDIACSNRMLSLQLRRLPPSHCNFISYNNKLATQLIPWRLHQHSRQIGSHRLLMPRLHSCSPQHWPHRSGKLSSLSVCMWPSAAHFCQLVNSSR